MFKVDKVYRRSELHDAFGGSRQGGIAPSRTHDIIMIFTGPTGEQYGYRDGWKPDGSFAYTGEGQAGDMEFKRGNKAIRDHVEDGRTLHLFEKEKGPFVRYCGELMYDGHKIEERVNDRDGRLRSAIVFRLIPVDRSAGGAVSQ